MKYDELDDKAKERARDWYRDASTDYNWWDSVYADAIQMASCLGIAISSRMRNDRCETEIYFSGFCSQGDGCCYSGTLYPDRCKTAVERVAAEAPQDETLAELAKQAQQLHDRLTVEQTRLRLLGEDHELAMPSWITITGGDRYWRTSVSIDDDLAFLEEELNDLVSGFADWIYAQLEAEHEHLTSDESCEEGIRSNDYDFDEDGRI